MGRPSLGLQISGQTLNLCLYRLSRQVGEWHIEGFPSVACSRVYDVHVNVCSPTRLQLPHANIIPWATTGTGGINVLYEQALTSAKLAQGPALSWIFVRRFLLRVWRSYCSSNSSTSIMHTRITRWAGGRGIEGEETGWRSWGV